MTSGVSNDTESGEIGVPYDPNDQEQFDLIVDKAILQQFSMKIGLKIMSISKEDGEFSLI